MKLNLYEMSLKRKNISRLFITLFIILLAVFFISKYLIVNKIEDYVENLPSHIGVTYDDLNFNLFAGSLNLENVNVTIKGQTTNEVNAKMAFEAIDIENLSYLDYVFKDGITIEVIKLLQPEITYYHNGKVKNESYSSAFKNKLNKAIHIDVFEVNNADINVLNIENDSLIFASEHLNVKLSSVESNTGKSEELPLTFKDITITSEHLKYAISPFENLDVSSLSIDTENAEFSDVKLKTKYSKSELSKRIETERDHYDLSVASVNIKSYKLDIDTSLTAAFETKNIVIDKPVFHIYRDKLIADDSTRKPLYSKMLRHLDFGLNLEEVTINNAEITYEEHVNEARKPGKLEFSNLNADIKNMSNIKSESGRTTLNITSDFMKETPLKVDWNFDVTNVNDEFIFKADIGLLKADHLNQFMKPNLNLKLEGELLKTYFTIDGNANTSIIDLKTDYDQFDIIILKENGEEKNKFLSGLINLFVAKDSNDSEDRFRYSDTKTVERDKTKSVFNFVWKNAKSGLKSAMAGDGEKDN